MFSTRLILVFSFLIVFTALSLAQVDTAWVRRYNGPANAGDMALALAVDASGNVYVTGESEAIGTGYDYTTIKYKPNGDTAWVRRYNGPGNSNDQASGLAVDDSGNVYITGGSWGGGTNYDYATIKYKSDGDTAWVRRSDGPTNGYDWPYVVALDATGNVYLTGISSGDCVTIKYAPNGDTSWLRRYNGPGNNGDVAYALAVDTGGKVYVSGGSYNGTSWDYATVKYAPNGDTTWARLYNGSGNGDDQASALAVDDSGNVYVTGYSLGSVTSDDYVTIKYKPNGDTAWLRRYNGPGNASDRATALAVDKDGNIYVTGSSGAAGNISDYATIKYAPNGSTVWVKRYNGPGNLSDYAHALALDDSGYAYVTGESPGVSAVECATVKYKPNGDTAWVERYSMPGGASYGYDITVDASDNVIITGYSSISGQTEYTTIKYSSCTAKAGDANASGTYSLSDVIATVNYIFNKPGCSPVPLCWLSSLLCRGDWDGSGTVTLSDAIRAVNYIFNKPGGPWNALPSGVCCM